MNKNIALDTLAYFCFCALVGTGLLLEFRLCEDERGTILGISVEDWSDIHEWVAYLFIALVVLHLVLHWAWIKSIASRYLWGTIVVFVAGLFVIGVLLLTPVRHTGKSHHDCGPEQIQEHDD